MKISIIVPVYNTEKLLPRCLDSILAQTYRDLEVLVIDDGSTDRSGSIANDYARKDSRIKVFHQKNGGVSVARNKGLQEATGDYIAFVDSDDYILPTMYQRLLETQNTYHTDVVTSDFFMDKKIIKNSLEPNRVYSKEEIFNTLLPSFSYPGTIGVMAFTNKLFKADFIRNARIVFNEEFAFQEDLMFMIHIYAHIESLYYLPEAFYEYYPTCGGLYSAYRENGGEKFIVARNIMISLIEKYKIPNIDWDTFNNAFLYNISFYIYRTYNFVKEKQKQNKLINNVLENEIVISCCQELAKTATSFDRRIASAIYRKKKHQAIFLVRFVYSGKAAKVQKMISKIKGSNS